MNLHALLLLASLFGVGVGFWQMTHSKENVGIALIFASLAIFWAVEHEMPPIPTHKPRGETRMAMSMEQMEGVIRAATTGSKLRLVFKRGEIADVMYLVNAVRGDMVKVDKMTEATLVAIMQSKDWGGDSNRTVQMEVLPAFSAEYFRGRLLRRIEKIEAVK